MITTEVPNEPENLRASDIKPESVKLTWKAPTDDGGSPVTAYAIFKRPSGTEDWEEVAADVPITSFVVPKLESGATYDFHVVAKNKHGAGKPAELRDVQTKLTISKKKNFHPFSPGLENETEKFQFFPFWT